MMDERQEAEARLKERDDRERDAAIVAEVEAERARQAMARAAEAEKQRQAKLRAEIGEEAQKWQAALDRAEAGAIQMAAGLREAFSLADQINALMRALPSRSTQLHRHETADRISRRLSVMLTGIEGPNYARFGQLDPLFSGLQIGSPNLHWNEIEIKHGAPWLAAFVPIKEKTK
jgi:hypothetical protein